MKKQLYWHVASNGELSNYVKDLEQAKRLIEEDFKAETENYDLYTDDLQYTITPELMTEEEFNNIPEN